MAEALNRTTQLTILRLSLERDATKLVPASVTFEVRLTGDPSPKLPLWKMLRSQRNALASCAIGRPEFLHFAPM